MILDSFSVIKIETCRETVDKVFEKFPKNDLKQ